MFKVRLLERLSKIDENPSYSGIIANPKEEIDSIFAYLKKILSTKEGSTLIAYDFGIPDISSYEENYGEYIRKLENKLKNTIEKYEPRLKNIKVKYIDKYKDKSILTFRIEAELANTENYPLVFETKIKPSGEVNIDEEH